MDEDIRESYNFEFVGGRLCLDFTNTVSNYDAGRGNERFKSYPALVAWGEQAGVLSRSEAERLLAEAKRHPQEADKAFEQAKTLREALHWIFRATAEGQPPRDDDLEVLN